MQNYIITHYVKTAFTKDGDGDGVGVITVGTTDGALLWPGARVIVKSTTQPAVEALILEDLGSGKFRVRLDDSSVGNYPSGSAQTSSTDKAYSPRANPTPKAASSWAAYLLADSAYIQQSQDQLIHNYTRDGIVPRTPSALTGQ